MIRAAPAACATRGLAYDAAVEERAACAQLKRRFEAAGFRIRENQTFDEDGVWFEIDGFDAERRVGYEYITAEAGDGWDVDGKVVAALAERRQRGELHVLVVDEADAPDAASLDRAIDAFLAELPAREAAAPAATAPAADEADEAAGPIDAAEPIDADEPIDAGEPIDAAGSDDAGEPIDADEHIAADEADDADEPVRAARSDDATEALDLADIEPEAAEPPKPPPPPPPAKSGAKAAASKTAKPAAKSTRPPPTPKAAKKKPARKTK